MVTAEHLDEARAKLGELETLTGYPPGTPDWFEAIGELADVEPLALQEFTISRLGVNVAGVGESVAMAVLRGLLVGLLAHRYAEADPQSQNEGVTA